MTEAEFEPLGGGLFYIAVGPGAGFYFRTEDEDLLGPYVSEEAAKGRRDAYSRFISTGEVP